MVMGHARAWVRWMRLGVMTLVFGGLMGAIVPTALAETTVAELTGSTPSLSEAVVERSSDVDIATFAGGCFWCMEPPFDKLPGVISTTSGYTGGRVANPSYRQVSGGGTGHVEAVQIEYHPAQVSYDQLLQVFWRNVDPIDDTGQFCDKGSQYRAAIFYQNEREQSLAELSKADLEASQRFDRPIAVTIRPAADFYAAEEYHQDYYEKNPLRYRFYRTGCGRDRRLEQLWGD